ncbi:MAG: MBL fold metallo-hydrolase [Microbacterium sp.]|nr:MBL fold metallo-hydrolase [Microbacterium sp.]
MPAARLRFLGATDTVTGSRYLIETAHARILVDCGLFQGYKVLRERNRAPFPVPPESIDAVVVTHAHLDHTGYLPALVRDGFRGSIHSTEGTEELSRLILPDSGHLQEEQADFAGRHGFSRHSPPEPLYTERDAWAALDQFRAHPFDTDVRVGDVVARFLPAGHILGAAQLRLEVEGARVHFTGDLGRADDPLMRPPRPFEGADVLVCESTYGNRIHPPEDPAQALGEIVTRVCARGGVVILPAFAIGRAETLLLHLSRLHAAGAIPDVPIFLNSPMAVDGSEIYQDHPEEHRVTAAEFRDMYRLATLVRSVDDSKLLNLRGGPAVIISASGMLEGGRVLHHIEAYGGDPRNAIVLTGFQAGGTRGAALQHGARELRIHGRDLPIRAEVHVLEMMSAHADADQIMAWLRTAPRPPRGTYLTHGEPDAADALRLRIERTLGWPVHVADLGQRVELTPVNDGTTGGTSATAAAGASATARERRHRRAHLDPAATGRG